MFTRWLCCVSVWKTEIDWCWPETRWQWSVSLAGARDWKRKDHLFIFLIGNGAWKAYTHYGEGLPTWSNQYLLRSANNSRNKECEASDLLLHFPCHQMDLISGVTEKQVFPGLQASKWDFFVCLFICLSSHLAVVLQCNTAFMASNLSGWQHPSACCLLTITWSICHEFYIHFIFFFSLTPPGYYFLLALVNHRV